MEEAVFRLVSREAMAALEREEAGAEGFGVPEMLRPLSASLGFALRVAVSNENLTAVSPHFLPTNQNAHVCFFCVLEGSVPERYDKSPHA